jgi:dTDP-4-amino-4,6-dideoxygalactose transaminase
MFGITCDMPEIIKAAQGKPIIEDCAQSIGSRLGGKMAGSFGTVAAFSFRSGKYLSVGEGGALFSDHAELCSRMSRLIAMMPAPSYAGECTHVIKTYIRSLLRKKPLWGIVGHRIWTIYNNKVEFLAKSPLVLNQIYRADFANTIHRLDNLEFAIEKQRSHAEYYITKLKLDPDMMSHETPGSYFNRYVFPIIFPSNTDRDFMARYLLRRKIGTAKPYQDIVDVAEKYFGYSRDCPVAENISKRLLIIPNHHALRDKDIQYIAKCFNEGLAELKYGPKD